MKKKDIASAAGAMSGLLRAGLPISDAAARMALLQPRHADMWHDTSRALAEGHPLSKALDGIWSPAMIAALRGGEHAGAMEPVLDQIEETIELEGEIREVAGKLIAPLVTLSAALGAFLFILGFVTPRVSAALNQNGTQSSGLMGFGMWLHDVSADHGVLVLAIMVAAVIAGALWLRTPSGHDVFHRCLFALPWVGQPLQDLQYTLWGRYVAMMLRSGVDIYSTLTHTEAVLPASLVATVRRFDAELRANKTVDQAARDITGWPFYIQHAFILGGANGLPENELIKVIPTIQKESVKRVVAGVKVANAVTMMASGALVAAAFFAIYAPIIAATTHSF